MKLLSIAALLLCLAGCNRAAQNKESIRQGVIDYVASKVNVSAMDIEVTAIAFKGAEADATVSFRPKGAQDGAGMEMRYTLEQKGGKWVVKDKAETGSPHGSAAAPPGEGGGRCRSPTRS